MEKNVTIAHVEEAWGSKVEREAESSTSRAIREIGEEFHAGFTLGMNHACEKRVTDTCIGDMWPEMYITMPPRNGNIFKKWLPKPEEEEQNG